MADCVTFRLYVGERLVDLVPLLVEEMRRRGASVSAGEQAGAFTILLPIGTVEGTYQVAGKSLVVAISNRPESVSCGTIESKVQDALLDAKALLKSRLS